MYLLRALLLTQNQALKILHASRQNFETRIGSLYLKTRALTRLPWNAMSTIRSLNIEIPSVLCTDEVRRRKIGYDASRFNVGLEPRCVCASPSNSTKTLVSYEH